MKTTDAPASPPRVGLVAPGTPPPAGVRRFQILLIKPSKYDDDGYVLRYVRGVLPSNTLAALAGLTRRVVERGELGDVEVAIELFDEHVHKVVPAKLARKYVRPDVRVLAVLCGVQTNQFPRAADLALGFHALGIPVMIGGFHVSGAIAMSTRGIPPECQELIDAGVTLVKGEIEDCWGDLLRDALHERLETYYDVVERPDLSRAELPCVDPAVMKKFAYPYMGTIDAGRGCPFSCSFCTIINVQGRTMRSRDPEKILATVRRNWEHEIDYYFFTDDNFARNVHWEAIFDGLIALRRDEGIAVQFMMQVDVLAYRLPNFMSKAALAGCSQVFIGMETINPKNLGPAGKRQNRVEDYQKMIDAWHQQGIACHVGYIIGFPFDSAESIRDDVRRLREDIGVDQASFFILTPLPGSKDHAQMVANDEWMDADYNRFDSFHVTTRHPRMSAKEWMAAYRHAWQEFYSTSSMKKILARATDTTYWGLFKNFLWYKHSVAVEDTHPMICGFFRLKDRKQRRPGFAIEPVWRHYRRRAAEIWRWARGATKLFFEMQEVWLATRGQQAFQPHLDDLRQRYAELRERVGDTAQRASDALGEKAAGLRDGAAEIWHRAGEIRTQTAEDFSHQLQRLSQRHARRVAGWRARLSRLRLLRVRTTTRADLDEFWRLTLAKLRRGRLLRINPFALATNFLRDARLCVVFSLAFILAYER